MSYNDKKVAEARKVLQNQPVNTRSWANMANEENALRPPAPPSAPATYKSKTYLPDASKWAAKEATVQEEASAERAETPNSLSESNLEDLRRTMYAYDNYTDRMGLPRRASRTPSRERRRRSDERRRTARRRSPSPRRGYSRRRSPSPRRRSRSPTRRYGVGRRYVAPPGFGSRRRSPSPRRRSPSPRRRSPSPRRAYSRRRSPSVSPLRYTVAPDGRTVNEFGRDVPRPQGPRFNTRKQGARTTRWNV